MRRRRGENAGRCGSIPRPEASLSPKDAPIRDDEEGELFVGLLLVVKAAAAAPAKGEEDEEEGEDGSAASAAAPTPAAGWRPTTGSLSTARKGDFAANGDDEGEEEEVSPPPPPPAAPTNERAAGDGRSRCGLFFTTAALEDGIPHPSAIDFMRDCLRVSWMWAGVGRSEAWGSPPNEAAEAAALERGLELEETPW
jgi:hypothetical protein